MRLLNSHINSVSIFQLKIIFFKCCTQQIKDVQNCFKSEYSSYLTSTGSKVNNYSTKILLTLLSVSESADAQGMWNVNFFILTCL